MDFYTWFEENYPEHDFDNYSRRESLRIATRLAWEEAYEQGREYEADLNSKINAAASL